MQTGVKFELGAVPRRQRWAASYAALLAAPLHFVDNQQLRSGGEKQNQLEYTLVPRKGQQKHRFSLRLAAAQSSGRDRPPSKDGFR